METVVFLFVSATKIYRFKANEFEIKPCLLFLENILKGFAVNNMMKTGLNGYIYNFFFDF